MKVATTPNEWKLAIDEFMDEAEADVKQVALGVAWFIFSTVVDDSPVWAGPYIRSHRINLDSIDMSAEDSIGSTTGWFGPKLSKATALSLKLEMKTAGKMAIKGMALANFKSIYISNSVLHAMAVEYGAGLTPPYHVYEKAFIKAKLLLETNPKMFMKKSVF